MIVLLAALMPAAPGFAVDDTVVSARTDAARIGEGDSLTLTIEVRGSTPAGVEDPDMSGLADFTIAHGPSLSTSTSMVWSGGQATSSTSKQFTYVLFPKRRGTLTIPSIPVKVSGRARQTDPIVVEVVEGRVHQTPGPRGRRGVPGAGRGGAEAEPAGEVYIEAEADKKEAWVGEQVLVIYRIYTQVDLVELPSPQQLPSYTGFWVEEIPFDPRGSIRRVTRDGTEFLEVTLMKKAIFPTTSGDLTIDETIFGVPVKVRGSDPFDSIFFTPSRTIMRKSRPITIHVKPLPVQGRPASFSGAVGRFSLEVTTDRQSARVNDALGLKVVVKGTGNIRTVGEPLLPPLPDYKRYDPKVDEKREVIKDRLSGTKTWDYVLTPLAPGNQDIPPIRFAWFDPSRGVYEETGSQTLSVSVERGDGTKVASGTPSVRREVTAFGRDVRYIKPVEALTIRTTPFHRSTLFAALLVVPVIVNVGLLLLVRRREHNLVNAGVVRGRRAPGFARRRLKQARQLLQPDKSREFHAEVAHALTGYLGDKLGVAASGLTHGRIEDLLFARGVDDTLRSDVRRCLERCDYAGFAPVAPGLLEMKELAGTAEQTIVRLERTLAGRGLKRAAALVLFTGLLLATPARQAVAATSAETSSLFAAANGHYDSGDYEKAIAAYRQLLTQGIDAPAVHYNLASALYKQGELGPAILELEKAAAAAPDDADIRANLEFLTSLTVDRTTAVGAQTTTFFLERLLQLTTVDRDAVIVAVLWGLVAAVICLWILASSTRTRRVAVWLIVALAMPLAVVGGALSLKLYRAATLVQAVILEERVDVLSGPGGDNTSLFTVHEGLKVRVRDARGTWSEVSLDNGLSGWVSATSLGII